MKRRSDVRRAHRAVDQGRADLVVLGAQASAPNADYGWITSGRPLGDGLVSVDGFVEKPPRQQARALFESGALWNTMITVARGQTLLREYRRSLPVRPTHPSRAQGEGLGLRPRRGRS